MNIIKEIESLKEEELDDYIKNRIEFLEEQSTRFNLGIDTIGFKLDYNPTNYHLLDKDDSKTFQITVRCFYSGYISKGMKMVYGMEYHNGRIASNNGNYYYVDDDKYIYDFCQLIRNKDVQNEFELFDYILEFMNHHFGNLKQLPERDEMHKLVLEKDFYYFKPTVEHVFSDFEKKGNAMCTEYSLMGQNLMSFFDITSYFVIGKEEDMINGIENHAFNLISFQDEEKEERNYLIDYSSPIKIFNENFEQIGKSPFLGKLERIDQDFVNDLIMNETHLSFKAYAYYLLGDTLLKLGGNVDREYYLDSSLQNKKSSKK